MNSIPDRARRTRWKEFGGANGLVTSTAGSVSTSPDAERVLHIDLHRQVVWCGVTRTHILHMPLLKTQPPWRLETNGIRPTRLQDRTCSGHGVLARSTAA